MKTNTHFCHISLSSSQNEMFHTKHVRKIETHFMLSNVSSKFVPLKRQVEEILHSRAGQRSQYNTAHAHCITEAAITDSEYVILTVFPR